MKGLNTRIRGKDCKDKDTSIKLVGKRGTKLIEPGADCIDRVDTWKNYLPCIDLTFDRDNLNLFGWPLIHASKNENNQIKIL